MRKIYRTVTLNEMLLGKKLNKVRNELNKLSKKTSHFTNPITVIALQQGIGKTHMFIEYAKNHWKNEKIILASPRHNHLEEVYNKLGNNKSRHWYGFSYQDKYNIYRGCNKLNQNIKVLNNLKKTKHESLLSPKFICNLLGCPKNRCRYYITRGKSNKIDLMPIEYLGTDLVLKQKPEIVFIDESIDKIEEYRYDISIISDCITIGQNNKKTQLVTNLNLISPKPQIGTIQKNLLDNIEDDTNDLIADCMKNNNYNDALKLNHLSNILKYLEYAPSYSTDVYYRPKIYDAFNLAYKHDIKVVFLNASFNDNLFTYFLETYDYNLRNITIPKYTSNIVNKNSTIIRVYPDNKFWKGAFAKYNYYRTLKDVFKVIRIVEKYIPKDKIGIITYLTSGLKNQNIKVEDKFIQRGYDTVHFWDEAGLNLLENKYVLFVVGTPFIPTGNVIDIWEKIYDEKADFKEEDIGRKDEDGYYITDGFEVLEYEDWEVSDFLWTLESIDRILKRWREYRPGYQWHHDVLMKQFNEDHLKKYDFTSVKRQYIDQLIDSIHRCRPLTHDRIIIALGDVLSLYPWDALKQYKSQYETINSVNQLLKIKQVEVSSLDALGNVIKNHNIVIKNKVREFLDFVLDNEGYISKTSIAKSLKIWNQYHNADTKFIKEIEKMIDDVKEKIT